MLLFENQVKSTFKKAEIKRMGVVSRNMDTSGDI